MFIIQKDSALLCLRKRRCRSGKAIAFTSEC